MGVDRVPSDAKLYGQYGRGFGELGQTRRVFTLQSSATSGVHKQIICFALVTP